MSDSFVRTRALLGDEAMKKLEKSRVAVFGLGGVGGYVAEALCRSGVGAIDLVDPDRIDNSNINRQIFATESSVGKLKTEVAFERLSDINPHAELRTHNLFYSPETADAFKLGYFDAVVDAIDFMPGKIMLAERARKCVVKLFACLGTGRKTDPSLLRVSDIFETTVCPMARKMRAELKKRGVPNLTVVWSPETPARNSAIETESYGTNKKFIASAAIVPAVAGLILADAVLKYLIGKN